MFCFRDALTVKAQVVLITGGVVVSNENLTKQGLMIFMFLFLSDLSCFII